MEKVDLPHVLFQAGVEINSGLASYFHAVLVLLAVVK